MTLPARTERVRAIFDVELTTRCNANCVMCPRSRTPDSGDMTADTFRQVVQRAVEYAAVDSFVLCGLGEPLMHDQVVEFVRTAAQAGLEPSIVTNGSLLDRAVSEALLEAGVRNVNLSLGGFTRKTYQTVHPGLDRDQVYRNGLTFLELAKGKATLNLQISPTEETVREAPRIADFWRCHGAQYCFIFPFTSSRGGSLTESDSAHFFPPETPRIPARCLNIEQIFRPSRRDARIMAARAGFVCYAKDRVTFINYKGNYHLCCNDYEKRCCIDSVYGMTVEEAFQQKATYSPQNCELCADCDFRDRKSVV